MNLRKILILLPIAIFLSGCMVANSSNVNTNVNEPTSAPEEIAMQTPAPLLENVEPTPDFLLSCENINEHGIPSASTNIQKSHILFMANNIDTSLNEFWVISLKNGARKQISKPEILSTDFYFLDDGYHFIMNQHNGMVAIGDIDDNAVEYVDINDSILEKLPPYSILWQRFQEGNQNFTNSPIGAYSRGEVYSPDGRKFASYSLGDDALYIIDVESRNKIPVIYTPVDEFGRAATISGQWTKNSEQFMFSRTWKEPNDDAIYSQLYSVDRNGENLRQLIDPLTNKWINSIQISPNQEKIVMGIMQLDDLHREMFGILNLVTDEFQMFATGGPTRSQMHRGSFTWSPDNRYLAYITHWYQIDIRIIDLSTGEYYCLTNDDAIETALFWK